MQHDPPHHPQRYHKHDPYDYEHLQYDEFPEFDHGLEGDLFEGDDDFGYDQSPVEHHPMGHQGHPMGHQGHPMGHPGPMGH